MKEVRVTAITEESVEEFMDRVCMDSTVRVVERILDSEDRLRHRYAAAGLTVTREGLVYQEGRK